MKLFKGVLIGLGSLIPGLSGSLIATILNVYHELIEALNRLIKHPIKSLLSIWPYLVGIGLGFGLGFMIIQFLLDYVPFPTACLIAGLILGSVPTIVKRIQKSAVKWHHGMVFLGAFLITIGLSSLNQSSDSNGDPIALLLPIGFIYATALIVPGLSGSTLLLAIGFFPMFLWMGSELFKSVMSLDGSAFLLMLPAFAFFIGGIFLGLVMMGKLMHAILTHYQSHFYYGVLGMMMASPISVFLQIPMGDTPIGSLSGWILGLAGFGFLFGILGAYQVSKGSK